MNLIDCGYALALLMSGHAETIARVGWNGKGMFVFRIENWRHDSCVSDSYERLPFLAMKTADDKVVPWTASQTDMLAEDWFVVK